MTTKEQRRQKYLRQLQLLRPIDDDFMRCLFKDDIALVQMVLRIITGITDLKIIKCQTQKDLKRLGGARSIILDALAEDSTGRRFDIEVQRDDKGADPYRARYHSSVLDVESLRKGRDFSKLPETYIIFITEKDFFGSGKPVYTIERMNLDTGKPFGDGEHILYVNGEYRGPDDLGRLMHDFFCTSAAEMKFSLMAEKTRYLKESEEGVGQMCKIMEDLKEEGRKEGVELGRMQERKEVARLMLEEGLLELEKIAKISRLPLNEVKKIQKKLLAH